jgi:heat-inducible transcriptional repressor
MKNKVELILEELIKEYLKELSPISSTKLKEKANLPFSASSIRSYMQKLHENGLIEKEHLSSGSKPSQKALKVFWIENFQNLDLDFKNLEEKVVENNLYFSAKIFENELLKKVYKYEKFIILEFEKNEFIFKYDENLYIFLKSFEGIAYDQIRNYLEYLNLSNIFKKFDLMYEYLCYNQKRLFDLNQVIDIKPFIDFEFDSFQKGLNFMNEILIYKNLKKFDDKWFEYILVGDIYSNFLNLIKGGAGEEKK